jgi:hypothetical protein
MERRHATRAVARHNLHVLHHALILMSRMLLSGAILAGSSSLSGKMDLLN